jgi:hypothetical protein
MFCKCLGCVSSGQCRSPHTQSTVNTSNYTTKQENTVACYLVTQQITCEFWIWHSAYWNIRQAELQLVASTILQHINFTVDCSVRRLLRSPLNWLLLSTDLTLHCWLIWPFTVLSSVSHSLKLILCRLEREHLLQTFNFLFSDACR